MIVLATKPLPAKPTSSRMQTTLITRLDKNHTKNSQRQTFAALEEDSSDDIIEEYDRQEPPPKLGKRDRNSVKEAPRTRQVCSSLSLIYPRINYKQRSTKKSESQASKVSRSGRNDNASYW